MQDYSLHNFLLQPEYNLTFQDKTYRSLLCLILLNRRIFVDGLLLIISFFTDKNNTRQNTIFILTFIKIRPFVLSFLGEKDMIMKLSQDHLCFWNKTGNLDSEYESAEPTGLDNHGDASWNVFALSLTHSLSQSLAWVSAPKLSNLVRKSLVKR